MTGCTTTAAVMPATPAELTRLSHVLAAAFATDPVSDWLFDGDQDTRHPQFFHAFLHHAFQTGRVEQTLDGTGVAVWFDNTRPSDPIVELAFGDRVRDTVGHPGRWHALDTALRAAHPAGPHWWLVFLGVLPAHQHRGYGHLLLHHATTWQAGHPAYLEATSRRLAGFYRRRGYHPSGRLITVEGGPRLHPMTRPARPA